MGFTRKYLSADGLVKIVQHSILREEFKVLKDATYTWKDCIMSGLAVFGFKMPSLLFEHNYGHGYKNLCSVMTMLMMLAFLIDQVQQLCCKVYLKARKHVGTLRRLFEKIQNRIDIAVWDSWEHLLSFIGDPTSRPPPIASGWIIA
jgi:hypothetical protein